MRFLSIAALLCLLACGVVSADDVQPTPTPIRKNNFHPNGSRKGRPDRYRRRPHIHLFHLTKPEGDTSTPEPNPLGQDLVRLGQDLLSRGTGHHPGHVVGDIVNIGEDLLLLGTDARLTKDVISLGQDMFFLGQGHHPGNIVGDLRNISEDIAQITSLGPGLLKLGPGGKFVTTSATSTDVKAAFAEENTHSIPNPPALDSSAPEVGQSGPDLMQAGAHLIKDVINLEQDLLFLGQGHHPGHVLEDLRNIREDIIEIGSLGPGNKIVEPAIIPEQEAPNSLADAGAHLIKDVINLEQDMLFLGPGHHPGHVFEDLRHIGEDIAEISSLGLGGKPTKTTPEVQADTSSSISKDNADSAVSPPPSNSFEEFPNSQSEISAESSPIEKDKEAGILFPALREELSVPSTFLSSDRQSLQSVLPENPPEISSTLPQPSQEPLSLGVDTPLISDSEGTSSSNVPLDVPSNEVSSTTLAETVSDIAAEAPVQSSAVETIIPSSFASNVPSDINNSYQAEESPPVSSSELFSAIPDSLISQPSSPPTSSKNDEGLIPSSIVSEVVPSSEDNLPSSTLVPDSSSSGSQLETSLKSTDESLGPFNDADVPVQPPLEGAPQINSEPTADLKDNSFLVPPQSSPPEVRDQPELQSSFTVPESPAPSSDLTTESTLTAPSSEAMPELAVTPSEVASLNMEEISNVPTPDSPLEPFALQPNAQQEPTNQPTDSNTIQDNSFVSEMSLLNDDNFSMFLNSSFAALTESNSDFALQLAVSKQRYLEQQLNAAVTTLNSLVSTFGEILGKMSKTKLNLYSPTLGKLSAVWQTAVTSVDRAIMFSKLPQDILSSVKVVTTTDQSRIALNQKMAYFQLGRAAGQLQAAADGISQFRGLIVPESLTRTLSKYGVRHLVDLPVAVVSRRTNVTEMDPVPLLFDQTGISQLGDQLQRIL